MPPLIIAVMAPLSFIACPECGCHAKSHEVECPHCGARIRRADGTLPRTAAAVLLGLTAFTVPAAGALSGCGGGDDGGAGGTTVSSSSAMESAAAYGVSGTTSGGGNGGGGGGGAGGSMGIGGQAAAYGVPMTDNDKDGYFAPADDCNDNDANIHPNAQETPGDGVDSNCNNDDNT